uniref:Uncharacterized protein n=1 Tax=Glossina austeni TaxID=7395 RepID=A0A1A9V0F3_GLOAU
MNTENLRKSFHVDVPQRPAYTTRTVMSHGLLGAQYVTQHMMIDDNWSIQQLIDRFNDLKRVIKTHETIKQIRKQAVTSRVDKVVSKLRTQVHNGRLLLKRHRYHTNKQVMQYMADATYYDVIIRSLVDDIKDQDNYIHYILDIGKPAFELFRVLSLNYAKRRDKVQKTLRKFNESIQKNTVKLRRGSSRFFEANATKNLDVFNIKERYERSAKGMPTLEKHLERVTNAIRDLKAATLTSNSTKIYEMIKNQEPVNRFMHKEIQLDELKYKAMIFKKEMCIPAKVIISHNFNVPHMNFELHAFLLKAAIGRQDMYEIRITKHMKERSKLFVVIRFALLHLFDMLRVVNAPIPRPVLNYPNADLKLPLLRFEKFFMFRPPAAFEENLERLMTVIKKNLTILMKRFVELGLNEKTVEKCNDNYRKTLVAINNVDADDDLMMFEPHVKDEDVETEDDGGSGKSWANVPNRQRIKQISAKYLLV